MPFYFRKSVSAGPFRFNFSKGGVGMSVGVKGLRIGTGPRGHYVQAGVGGFYYRASLNQPQSRNSEPIRSESFIQPSVPKVPNDGMTEITSANATMMQESTFSDLLGEINQKSRQVRMSMTFCILAALIVALPLFAIGEKAAGAILFVPLAWAIGGWLDSFNRATVLFYEVEDKVVEHFKSICEGFDALAVCAGIWHVQADKKVQDLTTWKRQAGASNLIRRSKTKINYALPDVLKCNITPPMLQVGKSSIYFMPDMVLVRDATGYGAVGYDKLRVEWELSSFIETDRVPPDAEISHYTWAHPNKSGGPDRRYKNNHQIPVCNYEAMHLLSASGLNEILQFSKRGLIAPLALAFKRIPKNNSIKFT